MDWATGASVEIILAIAFGCFIGWIIVTAIKSSQRREKRMDKSRKTKESEIPSEYWKSVDEKVAKQKFLDQLYETSKLQGRAQPKSTEESGDIDEYHK